MRNPRELKVYETARNVAHEIYRLTASFPPDERYGLTQQIRRAAVSVFSNIAEGCSRRSQADFARFIEIAIGSVMEVEAQLTFANELGLGGSLKDWSLILDRVQSLSKALISLSKTLRAET